MSAAFGRRGDLQPVAKGRKIERKKVLLRFELKNLPLLWIW
jgi:hypothetical protein